MLVVEDGPTLTHGEMKFGAGVVAAGKFSAAEIVDPRPYTVGTITETFKKYPDIGVLLPAMGYGDKQVKDLETTINRTPCDTVIIGTPIDLNRLIKIKKPTVRVSYELQEIGKPDLMDVLGRFLKKARSKKQEVRSEIESHRRDGRRTVAVTQTTRGRRAQHPPALVM